MSTSITLLTERMAYTSYPQREVNSSGYCSLALLKMLNFVAVVNSSGFFIFIFFGSFVIGGGAVTLILFLIRIHYSQWYNDPDEKADRLCMHLNI